MKRAFFSDRHDRIPFREAWWRIWEQEEFIREENP